MYSAHQGVAAVMSTLTLARADNTISGLYFCRACNALAELSSTVDSDKVNITVISKLLFTVVDLMEFFYNYFKNLFMMRHNYI